MSRFRQRIISSNNARNNDYLNFIAVSESPVIIKRLGNNTELVYYTFKDPKFNDWIEFNENSTITLNKYSIIYFKGNLGETENLDRYNNYLQFSLSGGDAEIHGNIMSLTHNRELKDYIFKRLFAGCSNIISAPDLPSTILAEGCYYEMFNECTSLIKTPELNATIIPSRAYFGMFAKCNNLKKTPKLSASTLGTYCYARMFEECTSLTEITNLPALSIPNYAYSMMFRKCINLEDTSIISATSVGIHGCEYMFSECYNLQNVSELKAIILSEYCYYKMFSECYELIIAPELPATTLAEGCYMEMFSECFKLMKAPKLEASTLVNNCYNKMFYNCSSLSNLETLIEIIQNDNSTENWLEGTRKDGILMMSIPQNIAPNTWQTRASDYSTQYLYFETGEYSSISFSFSNDGLSYSLDEGNTWTILPKNTNTPVVKEGRILWKGNLNPINNEGIGKFSTYGSFRAGGNIMSLIYGDNFANQTNLDGKDYAFYGLFENCYHLTWQDIILPATILSPYCYAKMFKGTSIKYMPDLPAINLVEGCYQEMFYSSQLLEAKELNAINLAKNCYNRMFYNCIHLTKAPDLKATILQESCYESMFVFCKDLFNPPEIKATTLAKNCCKEMFMLCENILYSPTLYSKTLVTGCYEKMFDRCNSLKRIEALFTTTPSDEYTKNWVRDVNQIGEFIKEPGWNILGNHGVPYNWTITEDKQEYRDSYLTFTSLENSQYKFNGNNIKYSLDNGETWTTLINGEYTPSVSAGNKILWKGTLSPSRPISEIQANFGDVDYDKYGNGIGTFLSTGEFSVSGNIASLLFEDNFENENDIENKENFIFYKLFYNCQKLKHSNNLILPFRKLSIACYYKMFAECQNLEDSPQLPSITLKDACYSYMFLNCIHLINIPEILPAEDLSDYCYKGMFKGCSNILTIPEIKVKTLKFCCCMEMFAECISLTTIKLNEEAEIAAYCYSGMFQNCINLINIYNSNEKEFKLSSSDSKSHCYYKMFYGCTSLTIAPEILCINANSSFCESMFEGCINLEIGPSVLYSTSTESYCYYRMFKDCKKLQQSPYIKISTVKNSYSYSFQEMFKNCSSLKLIIAPNVNFNYEYVFSNWVDNISNQGIFVTNQEQLIYGKNGIPENWEIISYNEYQPNLVFDILTEGTVTLAQNSGNSPKIINYSIDEGNTWNEFITSTTENAIGGVLSPGTKLLIKGDEYPCSYDGNYMYFSGTAKVNVGGNITALVNNKTNLENGESFFRLFKNNKNLISCEDLQLPAEQLSTYCYNQMFMNCESLIYPPKELPAMQLSEGCYSSMFEGCIKLEKSPNLPAKELVKDCYSRMFYNCTNLNSINVNFIEWNGLATNSWVYGVNNGSHGYFYKSVLLPIIYGQDYIPSQSWFDINTSIPVCFKFDYDNSNNVGSVTIDFTGKETHDGGVTFTTTSSWNINDDISPKRQMQYSTNKGKTWTRIHETTTTQSASEIWIMAFGGNYNEEHSTEINEQTGYYQYQRKVWISLKPNNLCTVEGNLLSFDEISISNFSEWDTTYRDLSSYTTILRSYEHLFDGAINIIDANNLIIPSFINIISQEACAYMFKGCTRLQTAPKLPTKYLSYGCYAHMFENCTSLTTAPELPGIIAPYCYYEMFKGCTSLETIPSIPEVPDDREYETIIDPLRFEFINGDGFLTIYFTGEQKEKISGNIVPNNQWELPLSFVDPDGHHGDIEFKDFLQYSINKGKSWVDVTSTTVTEVAPEIWIRGHGANFWGRSSDEEDPQTGESIWWMEGWISYRPSSECRVKGNTLHITNWVKEKDDYRNITYRFIDDPNDEDYDQLTPRGYMYMFRDAKNIVDASNLIFPDEEYSINCVGMFKGCISLVSAPTLPFTYIGYQDCLWMFEGCTSLQRVELPALRVGGYGYFEMFKGCSNLNYVKAMFTNKPTKTDDYSIYNANQITGWLDGVSETGTFVKNPDAQWDAVEDEVVPSGWTIETNNQ